MSAEIRQDLWKNIDYNTILFDRFHERRVVVVWTDEVIDRGWAQPCYGKDDRWDRAPNYLNIKVLSCDDGPPFVEDWKITIYKSFSCGNLVFGRIFTKEDFTEEQWNDPMYLQVEEGLDYFCRSVDVNGRYYFE